MRGNTLNSRAQLTTPFRSVRRIIVVVNHEGPVTAFKNDASFELNAMRVSGKSEFNLNGANIGAVTTGIVDYFWGQKMWWDTRPDVH
jgi:hypothetical protein